jgi:hemoglobin-like flavoprotein
MVTAVVESLDDFEPMRARLAELGCEHADYGVQPQQYETVTKAFLWSLGQALGADFDVPSREAWCLAINTICAAMKAGLV